MKSIHFIMTLGTMSFLTMVSVHAALIHQWTFNDGTARDSVGSADAVLYGSAFITNGQLSLDGSASYAATSAMNDSLSNKTILVWERLETTNQDGGCPLSIETPGTSPYGHQVFDGIDYGELTAHQWMAGSDLYTRSLLTNNGGGIDLSLKEHMLAITYNTNGAITIYRDGYLYANAGTYALVNFASERYLLGRRHDTGVGPASPYFNGTIDEARVYSGVLTVQQIADIYAQGPTPVHSDPVLAAPILLSNGSCLISYTNDPMSAFTVLASTNLSLPVINWVVLGRSVEIFPGTYQFTDTLSTNYPYQFYRLQWP